MFQCSQIHVLLLTLCLLVLPGTAGARDYNGAYEGETLNRVAFPLGGMGGGMVCLEGTGALSHVSVRNRMEAFHEPYTFAALCVKGQPNVARVLEGPVPAWKVFGAPRAGRGADRSSYGLPRFDHASFQARFPFGAVTLDDPQIPLSVKIVGWSPFIPGDPNSASLPVAGLEYHFENPQSTPVEAVFSFNSKNFMRAGGATHFSGGAGDGVQPIEHGFVLHQTGTPDHPENEGSFAVFTDDPAAVVDHSWFRGGWWDPVTLVWQTIEQGRVLANPPQAGSCPGASLFVPLRLEPGQRKTLRLMFAWYVPHSTLRTGSDPVPPAGPAFGAGPASGTASGQQIVSGFLGQGLVNTYAPLGDGQTGTLRSPKFRIERDYLHFLVGGGNNPGQTCVNLLVNAEVVRSATGHNTEALSWVTWPMKSLKGKAAVVEIVDQATGAWGHINVDQFVATDSEEPIGLYDREGRPATAADLIVLQDFEAEGYADWQIEAPPQPCCPEGVACESRTYVPWYAGRFKDSASLARYWRDNYRRLRQASAAFSETFYDTTLPDVVVEAIAANLTILKSPTVLRQADGRLWCFEGCNDDSGCCSGSCTHVWNYAQAICHLFPALERTLRETEFQVSQDERGHQTFRSNLPIRPVAHGWHAASDGQLGGIMKAHREWRISGDTAWLQLLWPRIKQSLDYCIQTWDPRGKGVLEEPHHNTYDIEFWGPDGMCSSFYLGALRAAIEMGTALDADTQAYERLLDRGRRTLETELFDGEYFYQQVTTQGLNAKFNPLQAGGSGTGYRDIVQRVNQQGPKYQYGTGCISDGVLGFWLASMCGLSDPIVDRDKVRSNLAAIHRYNLKADLSDHANPQRPSYALGHEGGLLLCTWPKGGKLSLPFVYSNEVWTGIEYQVAGHLMQEGMVKRGLDIVRACRDRYDGRVRNPFNEYECGHWYARAMSSYGMLQALTGLRYDAVDQTLFVDSQVGNFRSFLSCATGWGSVELKDGKPSLSIRAGDIDVKHCLVSGRARKLKITRD